MREGYDGMMIDLRLNSGRITRPIDALGIITRHFDEVEALRIYSDLEESGRIIPMAYRDGRITKVKIRKRPFNYAT